MQAEQPSWEPHTLPPQTVPDQAPGNPKDSRARVHLTENAKLTIQLGKLAV